MRSILFTLSVATALIGGGCKHGLLRKPCKDDECNAPRSPGNSGGVRLGEPTPSRIPPANVPLRPEEVPPPSFEDERRFRPQPPPASIPLPSEADARRTAKPQPLDGWLDEPIAPNGFRLPGKPDVVAVEDDVPPRRSAASINTKPAPSPATPTTAAFIPFPERPTVTVGKSLKAADYDALKRNGVPTILFVLSEKAELAAAQTEAEKRGFTVVPLIVTPETLKDASRIFAQALANKKPLHIVDDKTLRVGFLSYLYFRKTQQRGEDVSRVLARPLGLPDAAGEDAKPYWIAAQTAVNAP